MQIKKLIVSGFLVLSVSLPVVADDGVMDKKIMEFMKSEEFREFMKSEEGQEFMRILQGEEGRELTGSESINPGEPVRYWVCDLGAKLELYQTGRSGKIVLNGVEVDTDYRTDGLDRVWLWGGDSNNYRYQVKLQGDIARYYIGGWQEDIYSGCR